MAEIKIRGTWPEWYSETLKNAEKGDPFPPMPISNDPNRTDFCRQTLKLRI